VRIAIILASSCLKIKLNRSMWHRKWLSTCMRVEIGLVRDNIKSSWRLKVTMARCLHRWPSLWPTVTVDRRRQASLLLVDIVRRRRRCPSWPIVVVVGHCGHNWNHNFQRGSSSLNCSSLVDVIIAMTSSIGQSSHGYQMPLIRSSFSMYMNGRELSIFC